jgi:hypothetical protein
MRTLALGAAALSVCLSLGLTLGGCGEIIPLTPDAQTDAMEIDAVGDICEKSSLTVDEFFTCVGRSICGFYGDCVGSDVSSLNCDDIDIEIFGGLEPTAAKVVIAAAVAAGRTTWNPTTAKACLDALTGTGCALFKNNGDPFAACGALTGAVNNGQLCQNDIECATPGAQCEINPTVPQPGNQCTDYTCRAPVPAGNMCTGGAICRPEDHCVSFFQGADISVCRTGEAGQQCDDNGDCDRGNFCNGGLGDRSAAGICTTGKAAGATCKTDEECMGELACVGNFGAVNGICRDVRPPGAMCDNNNLAYSCHGNQVCNTTAVDMVGTCGPAPSLGQTCVMVNGAGYCGFFLACENGLCREPGAVGEVCTRSTFFGGSSLRDPNGCNLGLFCNKPVGQTMGTCADPLANGQSCLNENWCDSDSCMGAMPSSTPPVPGTCATYPTCTF